MYTAIEAAAFEMAWKAGQAMTLDQAIAEALNAPMAHTTAADAACT